MFKKHYVLKTVSNHYLGDVLPLGQPRDQTLQDLELSLQVLDVQDLDFELVLNVLIGGVFLVSRDNPGATPTPLP